MQGITGIPGVHGPPGPKGPPGDRGELGKNVRHAGSNIYFIKRNFSESVWYVCSRVSGVKRGRMAPPDLQDLKEKQDLQ